MKFIIFIISINCYNSAVACDLYQLKTFYVLARTLSFTEAARKLFITQPAVSHSLKKLEASLGSKLISKRGPGYVLTESGRILFEACEDVFSVLDKAEESIRRNNLDYLGKIRLGATIEFGTSVLVKNMKDFLSRSGNVQVDFRFSHELLPLLLSDELDVMIDCRDHPDPRLVRDALFREQYVVIGRPTDIAGDRIRKPKDLDRARIISMDEDGAWWERFLQAVPEEERPSLGVLTTINHIRGMIHAALEGIGIALVPKYCVSAELRSGLLKNVFPRIALHEDQFYIYQKKKKSGLETHRILVDYLKSIKPAEFGEV
jgi:DNA-binding transcriptional LysR family regulator